MELTAVMTALERAGSEATRKTYRRHGARPPLFGVSFRDLYALQKQLGTDHALAQQLWSSGNHDARVLATLIADAARANDALLEEWLHDGQGRALMGVFAAFAGKSPAGRAAAWRWIEDLAEHRQAAGWTVLAVAAGRADADEARLAALLPRIARAIHRAPNAARHAMNGCLIAIGGRPALTSKALAAAKQVGEVEVDHGDTACETPLASAYIEKMAARRSAKGAPGRAATKKAGKRTAVNSAAKPGSKRATKGAPKRVAARRR
jgi:3-methyladenine DNA glycosylase AlkD